jgi:hypothetical protein
VISVSTADFSQDNTEFAIPDKPAVKTTVIKRARRTIELPSPAKQVQAEVAASLQTSSKRMDSHKMTPPPADSSPDATPSGSAKDQDKGAAAAKMEKTPARAGDVIVKRRPARNKAQMIAAVDTGNSQAGTSTSTTTGSGTGDGTVAECKVQELKGRLQQLHKEQSLLHDQNEGLDKQIKASNEVMQKEVQEHQKKILEQEQAHQKKMEVHQKQITGMQKIKNQNARKLGQVNDQVADVEEELADAEKGREEEAAAEEIRRLMEMHPGLKGRKFF